MIKFFRHIRQSLLMENKTSKYIKYAIGEIVLVVIGILLALQINNWNSKRLMKSSNKVFLEKIINDLEMNKNRMKILAFESAELPKNYIPLEKALSNCDSLFKLTYRGLQESDLEFILNNNLGAGGAYLNLHNSTYEELINTGKLYTIGSDSLINAIKKYYKRCEREELYNKGNSETMREGFRIMRDGYYKMILDYNKDSLNFKINNYTWFFDKNSEKYQNIQIGLALIEGGQQTNFKKMEQIINYSDSLIFAINKELKD
ncbi:DUF6090 family protein [Hanstruepera ponticola]|uniref:DUF6090 family protein n=1 Tax=Hanstruepera ponticola TaxID=2042995 RepID=UPI000CF0C4C8|nr:DUF6090 family protein [Hanstruepera ponticola]